MEISALVSALSAHVKPLFDGEKKLSMHGDNCSLNIQYLLSVEEQHELCMVANSVPIGTADTGLEFFLYETDDEFLSRLPGLKNLCEALKQFFHELSWQVIPCGKSDR